MTCETEQRNGCRAGLAALCMIMVCALAAPANAERQETRATGAIDAKTFEILMQAQEHTESGEHGQALELLDRVRESGKLNSYARSQMWNFYAYIYAIQERYRDAIRSYRNILKEEDAPQGLKRISKYTLAQLHFQLEEYPEVIRLMEEWLQEVETPTTTAHIMLAQAHYQTQSMDGALRHIAQAIRLEAQEGRAPKEDWLRMRAGIHFERQDLRKVLEAYQELLRHYPRVLYLRQMAGLYGELGDERKRITTFDAIYEHGALDNEADLLNLAYMYLGQQIPYKAGRILEQGMAQGTISSTPSHIETLATAWAQANEHRKAIPALEQAAKLSDKGLLHARLAGVYFDAGRFREAADAARQAARKGGLKHRANNQMLLGMALFNIKEYEDALQAFRQAKESGKKRFADARQWERYVLAEIQRLQALEKSDRQLRQETEETLEAQENNADAIGGELLENAAE